VRVLVDANIYISYLLIPSGDRDPNVIVDEALAGVYVPLLVPELMAELQRKVGEKQYLRERIAGDALGQLVESLKVIGESLPALDLEPPAIGRDRKDDYLFAHAAKAQADFIVSGDEDVVAVGRLGDVRVLSTAEFALLLRANREARRSQDSG
jgi:uncharacterized protein